jgi:hypothetical protein
MENASEWFHHFKTLRNFVRIPRTVRNFVRIPRTVRNFVRIARTVLKELILNTKSKDTGFAPKPCSPGNL